MNGNSRIKNTLKNFTVSVGSLFFSYILSFATRTVFIHLLSVEYLGVNGLFSNVLSLLSLAELGAGGAFVSLLYNPIHNNDTRVINSIMSAFKKVYFIIAIVVSLVGLSLIPILDSVMKENNIENITLIYLLYLTNSVFSFICKHRITFITANQKNYIVTVYTQVFIVIQYILQILILILTNNYILYIIVNVLCSIATNLCLSRKAVKMYPYIKEKSDKLSDDLLAAIIKNVKGGFCLHTGHVIAMGTDNLVISKFLGLAYVGIYSNYILIIGIINKFIQLIFSSVNASIGNLVASGDREKMYVFFQRMQFLSFFLIGFSSSCLLSLLNPFITIWVGEEYTFSNGIVILIVLMLFFGNDGIRRPVTLYKNVSGLFYNDRWLALLEGILNIVFSLILVNSVGLAGVFIGTILSTLITFWSGSYVLYKYLFKRSLIEYIRQTALYFLITAATSTLVYFTVNLIPHNTLSGFVLKFFTAVIMTLGVFILVFYRSKEFRYFWDFCIKLINKQFKPKGV